MLWVTCTPVFCALLLLAAFEWARAVFRDRLFQNSVSGGQCAAAATVQGRLQAQPLGVESAGIAVQNCRRASQSEPGFSGIAGIEE